jgi:hypothetical protein
MMVAAVVNITTGINDHPGKRKKNGLQKAKPENHHRAEEATDLAAAVALERKQCKEDR